MMSTRSFELGPVQALLALVALLAIVFVAGCNDEPEQVQMIPNAQGARGESCMARNDCQEGLACVRNTCVKNEYPISTVSGSCSVIQCTENADCCDTTLSPYCESLQADCDNGQTYACDSFERQCTCALECNDHLCRQKPATCEDDYDCSFGRSCSGGKCGECTTNSQCSQSESCVNNSCESGCTVDANCPLFESCQDSKCVETGCVSDRECVLFTGSGDATCNDGQCGVACQNDAECNRAGNSFFEVCEAGRCVFVGCETDHECRIALGLADMDGQFSAVCE